MQVESIQGSLEEVHELLREDQERAIAPAACARRRRVARDVVDAWGPVAARSMATGGRPRCEAGAATRVQVAVIDPRSQWLEVMNRVDRCRSASGSRNGPGRAPLMVAHQDESPGDADDGLSPVSSPRRRSRAREDFGTVAIDPPGEEQAMIARRPGSVRRPRQSRSERRPIALRAVDPIEHAAVEREGDRLDVSLPGRRLAGCGLTRPRVAGRLIAREVDPAAAEHDGQAAAVARPARPVRRNRPTPQRAGRCRRRPATAPRPRPPARARLRGWVKSTTSRRATAGESKQARPGPGRGAATGRWPPGARSRREARSRSGRPARRRCWWRPA